MAVSAAELPEMSGATGDESERAAKLQERLKPALRRVVFLVVPSAVAFVAIGGPIISLLFQRGEFHADATRTVWIILAGSALGLSAGTQGRLLGSAFYALGDPKSPLRAALVRVAITGALGWLLAIPVREALGLAEVWGAFALTASAGFAAWVEFLLLDRWLSRRIGKVPIPARLGLGALGAAAIAGGAAFGANRLLLELGVRNAFASIAAIGVFGVIYFTVMIVAKVPEARAFLRRARLIR
jgi:putative peptidoglycan lipid II flippase